VDATAVAVQRFWLLGMAILDLFVVVLD